MEFPGYASAWQEQQSERKRREGASPLELLRSKVNRRFSKFPIRNPKSQIPNRRVSVSPRLPAIGFAFRRGGRVPASSLGA